jgi:hypothetical protein
MRLLRTDGTGWTSSAIGDEVQLGATGQTALLVPFVERGRSHVVLICASPPRAPVLLNGRPAAPVSLLGQDEVCVDDERFLLRESASAEPVRFVAADGERRCGRCKCAFVDGDVVAHCPCGLTFHQGAVAGGGEPRLCFSYAPCSCGRAHDELDGSEEEDPDA